MNPIDIEPQIIEHMKNADSADAAMAAYTAYLHEKQSSDYYYAKPNFFQTKSSSDVTGVYTLTSDVCSVFPLIPMSDANRPRDMEGVVVQSWQVALVGEAQDGPDMLGMVSFEKVRSFLEQVPHTVYDRSHWVVTLSTKEMQALLKM